MMNIQNASTRSLHDDRQCNLLSSWDDHEPHCVRFARYRVYLHSARLHETSYDGYVDVEVEERADAQQIFAAAVRRLDQAEISDRCMEWILESLERRP